MNGLKRYLPLRCCEGWLARPQVVRRLASCHAVRVPKSSRLRSVVRCMSLEQGSVSGNHLPGCTLLVVLIRELQEFAEASAVRHTLTAWTWIVA